MGPEHLRRAGPYGNKMPLTKTHKMRAFAWLAVALMLLSAIMLRLPLAPSSDGSASTTLSSLAPADDPSGIPITIWNNGSAINQTFNEPVNVPISRISGIASNASNLEFQYSNGTTIPAWVVGPESASFQGLTQIWLELHPLAANTNETIYASALSSGSSLWPIGPTGFSPEATCTDAHDNGAQVFTAYYNASTPAGQFFVGSGFTLTPGTISSTYVPWCSSGMPAKVSSETSNTGMSFVFWNNITAQPSFVSSYTYPQSSFASGSASGAVLVEQQPASNWSSDTNPYEGYGSLIGYDGYQFSLTNFDNGSGTSVYETGAYPSSPHYVGYNNLSYGSGGLTASEFWAGASPAAYSHSAAGGIYAPTGHLEMTGSGGGQNAPTQYNSTYVAYEFAASCPASNSTACVFLGEAIPLPKAPTRVSATFLSSTSESVQWIQSTSPGIVNNTVYLYSSAACSCALTGAYSTGGAATNDTLTGLTANQQYSVSVSAWNATGESPPSVCENFTAGMASFDYTMVSYTLTGYNPLSAYVSYTHTPTQLPVLSNSPSQPTGVYYVGNASAACSGGTLPFYIFYLNNKTVHNIACIVPLYGEPAYKGIIESMFFVEYGYDEATFFGTTTNGSSAYSIELVDLGTGALHMWNTTTSTAIANQEPIYVGNGTVIVLSNNGTAYAWDLWTHTEWLASSNVGGSGWSAKIEANNVYWIPEWSQLINVEAHGDTADQIIQLNGSWSGHQFLFAQVATTTYDHGYSTNGANGISVNLTTHQIAFSVAAGGTSFRTYVMNEVNGLLTNSGEIFYGNNQSGFGQYTWLLEQQYAYTSGFVQCFNPYGSIDTVCNPFSRVAMSTNVAVNRTANGYNACGDQCFQGTYAGSPDWLIPYGTTAYLFHESNTQQYNTPYYQIVYASASNASSFPPNSPPVPTGVAVSSVTFTTAVVSWTQATGGGIINNTVAYEDLHTLQPTQVSLSATTRANLSGLSPSTEYSVEVSASNATGMGPFSSPVYFNTTAAPTVPPAPTRVYVINIGYTTATVEWTQSAGGGIANNTVGLFVGSGCTGSVTRYSTGGAATGDGLTELSSDSPYSVEVFSWNATGESPASACVDFTTATLPLPAAPTGVSVSSINSASAAVSWTQSTGGEIANNTVYLYAGLTCSGKVTSFSLGSAGTSDTIYGLSKSTTYAVAVTAWNASGQSPQSACVAFTTPRSSAISLSGESFGWEWIILVVCAVALVTAYLYYRSRPNRPR